MRQWSAGRPAHDDGRGRVRVEPAIEAYIVELVRATRVHNGIELGVSPRGYMFRPFRHDPGTKTIFGRTGAYRPDDVVDLIFDQPQPANYLAKRLWLFFACDSVHGSDESRDRAVDPTSLRCVAFDRPGYGPYAA